MPKALWRAVARLYLALPRRLWLDRLLPEQAAREGLVLVKVRCSLALARLQPERAAIERARARLMLRENVLI